MGADPSACVTKILVPLIQNVETVHVLAPLVHAELTVNVMQILESRTLISVVIPTALVERHVVVSLAHVVVLLKIELHPLVVCVFREYTYHYSSFLRMQCSSSFTRIFHVVNASIRHCQELKLDKLGND